MLNFIKNFRNDEDGAVTVDFVVLTAAIVLLGLAVGLAITGAVDGVTDDIVADISGEGAPAEPPVGGE